MNLNEEQLSDGQLDFAERAMVDPETMSKKEKRDFPTSSTLITSVGFSSSSSFESFFDDDDDGFFLLSDVDMRIVKWPKESDPKNSTIFLRRLADGQTQETNNESCRVKDVA